MPGIFVFAFEDPLLLPLIVRLIPSSIFIFCLVAEEEAKPFGHS